MVNNEFGRGPESWCSYDYHASIVAGGCNIFILATWDSTGGPDSSGCIWTDHTRWSADTPERPLSILPLLFYRNWIDADPMDLRDAEVSVYLRGDGLRLDGAQCFFWVHGSGGRWHYTSRPLAISDAAWARAPLHVRLENDEQLWHHSWPRDPRLSAPLDRILGQAHSYGFSFVGFSSEVSGRLCMGTFRITLAGESQ